MDKQDSAEAVKPVGKTRPKKLKQPLEALYIPDALLEPDTVTAVTGLREAARREGEKNGTFPAAVQLSPNCKRHRAKDILAWLRAREPEILLTADRQQ